MSAVRDVPDAATMPGRMRVQMARISAMFAMLLPRTFPSAMPVFPVAAASVLTTSSGSEVPNAMIVDPIRAGEML